MSSSGGRPGGTVFAWLRARPMVRNAAIAGVVIVLIGLILGVQAKAAKIAAANQDFSANSGTSGEASDQGSDASASSASGAASAATPDVTEQPAQFENAPTVESNGTVNSNGPVILPATSSPIDTSTLFSSKQIDTSIFDTVADPTSGSAAFEGLVEFDIPADGLKPEYHELDYVRIAADGSATVSEKKLLTASDADGAHPESVWGVAGGLLIVGVQTLTSGGDSLHSTWALDSSGATVWKNGAELQSVVGDVPVIQTTYTSKSSGGYDVTCHDVRGLDAASGATRWSILGTTMMRKGGDCGSPQVDTDSPLNGGSSNAPTRRYVTVQYDDGTNSPNQGANVLPATGVAVNWRTMDSVTRGVVDPTTGDVYSEEGQDSAGRDQPAEVYDPASGKVLWSMSYAQAQDLGLGVDYFYGGTLYAHNSAQHITIDVASGKVSTDSWSDDDGQGLPYADVDGYTITTQGYLLKD